MAGCVHSSVNTEQATRVSYNTLTHSILYCRLYRDREKK